MRKGVSIFVVYIFLLTLSISLGIHSAYGSATIWTDKPDYAPWETVTISGSGFKLNTNVVLTITRPDLVVDTCSTMSDASGNFIYYYVLNGIVGTYTVTATDGTNTASTTFTESPHVDWTQGHDDTNPHDGVVDTPMVTWSSGDINAQNSILTEGNIVPSYPPNVPGHVNYRAIIVEKDLDPGTYILTIQYDFTKGGKVAFDFLTTNYGITDSNLQTQLPGWADVTKISSLVTAGPSTATFPYDTFSLPAGLGSGTVQDRQSVHDTVFTGLNPRKMKLYGATITSITQGSHSGPVTGDSSATVAVAFTKTTDDSWPIIATWGGHLGIGAAPPAGYGAGNGAGSVSGAPFHMSLDSLVNTQTGNDVLGGRRDRSVQVGAITPPPGTGTIVVQKITLGGVDTFWFDGAGTGLPAGFDYFSITTTTPGVAASTGFTNVNLGTYTVTEQALTGWDLTGIAINDPDGGSSYTGSTATLDVDSGETVTVTFTNTKRGVIIVHKATVPSGDPADFTFDPDYESNFVLSDGEQYARGNLVPGTYHVQELALAGWDLTGLTVTDPDFGSSVNLGTGTATIDLDAGETVHAYYTNTKRGVIIVHKATVPSGDPASFEFDPDYKVNFFLSDGGQDDSGALVPGIYHVDELTPAGWDLTAMSITDPSGGSSYVLATGIATVDLAAGETVHVYYTNTKQAVQTGHIIVHKDTVPSGDPADFTFDPDYQVSNFVLSDGEQYDSGAVAPGTYHVQELALAGWDLTGLTVTDPDGGSSTNLGTRTATIDLDAGETVHVYYTNTKQTGHIIVHKDTVPTGESQLFEFDPSWGSNFFLTDGQQSDSGALVPGTYSVAEVNIPAGWDLTNTAVSDGSPVNALSLQAGETITVTFTNTKRGHIIVHKATVPSGDPASFEFDPDYKVNFFLSDGGQDDSGALVPGIYHVDELTPAGWDLTAMSITDPSGGSSYVLATGIATVDLAAGETVHVYYTNTKHVPGKCTISDFVWNDLDHDGIQDVGEPGLPGVTVNLYDSLGNLVAATTTNGNGLYSFTVDPGSYYLEFVPPSGYVLTLQDRGTDDAKDSDADPTTHKTAIFTVTSGQIDSTRDVGMYARLPVGGEWIPVGKFSLLAPWISLGSVTALITASFVYVKRKKKQMS